MSPEGAALQLRLSVMPFLSPPFPITVMEVAVYILPSSIDWHGLWDLEVVQRGLRGLEVAQSVE